MSGENPDEESDRRSRFDKIRSRLDDESTTDADESDADADEADALGVSPETEPVDDAESVPDDDSWEWGRVEETDESAESKPSVEDSSEESVESTSSVEDSGEESAESTSSSADAADKTDRIWNETGSAVGETAATTSSLTEQNEGTDSGTGAGEEASPAQSDEQGPSTQPDDEEPLAQSDDEEPLAQPDDEEPPTQSTSRSGTRRKRIWSHSETDTETSTETATQRDRLDSQSAVESQTAAPDVETADPAESEESETEADGPLIDLDPAPGTNVLLQCGSQDDRVHEACHDLLGLQREAPPNVLMIQYRRVDKERLKRVATHAAQTTVVSVGYTQSVPDAVTESVEVVSINNPNDITRLGILVSKTLDTWDDGDATTVVCYDSVNVLLEYKDVQSTFRFFHVFLGTLESAGAIAHFHADPLAGTPQKINTLKPLFDEVVSIDSMGIDLE